MRQYLSCNLAFWHSYKQAVKMICKYFANTIWGPLWHRMYPGSKFNVCTPSPQEGSMHIVYMARAYPKFKDELENAIVGRAQRSKRSNATQYSSSVSLPFRWYALVHEQ